MTTEDYKTSEGRALEKLLNKATSDAGISRAEFCRSKNLKISASLIRQHITGNRPISVNAAIDYAAAIGCPIEMISPRLANLAEKVTRAGEPYKTEIKHVEQHVVKYKSQNKYTAIDNDEIILLEAWRNANNHQRDALMAIAMLVGKRSEKTA